MHKHTGKSDDACFGKQVRDEHTAKTACTQRREEITQADLPLSCPPRDERVWDAHPRVYLPIEETGKVLCPYCGCEYILKEVANLER